MDEPDGAYTEPRGDPVGDKGFVEGETTLFAVGGGSACEQERARCTSIQNAPRLSKIFRESIAFSSGWLKVVPSRVGFRTTTSRHSSLSSKLSGGDELGFTSGELEPEEAVVDNENKCTFSKSVWMTSCTVLSCGT